MITNITARDKKYHLIGKNYITNNENVFTLITGRNGVGKSRMLSFIVNHFIPKKDQNKFYKELYDSVDDRYFEIDYDFVPSNIIAVSTSAFDKFPVPKRRERLSNYSYLGIRGLSSLNISSEYLSKIIYKLIASLINHNMDMSRIANVLGYLGYHDEIEISLVMRSSNERFKEISASHDHYIAFEQIFLKSIPFPMNINRSAFLKDDGALDKEKIDYALYILSQLNYKEKRPIHKMIIDQLGVHIDTGLFNEVSDDFIFLIESGFLYTRYVTLHNKNSNERFRINNASSGEQCIVMSILGIASQIQDNSIICIDEPEICLHPEWQEKYISILMDTFKDYHNCHFIIATHSPQITSKLKSHNCFILSMQDGKVNNASNFINRSIDFQLANIFKAPGYKNEYLMRELISFLSELTETKKISHTRLIEIEKILGLKDVIENTDPVKKLMTLVAKSLSERRNDFQ
ncbi:AAA family ATPase [Sodalis sp. RH14]|uniref:AAA family ATPase n=1 Tax=Sodalis sp. RH14 TaxID=3394329 RepID=UPI0039B624E7